MDVQEYLIKYDEVEQSPKISVRKSSREIDVYHSSMQKMLKKVFIHKNFRFPRNCTKMILLNVWKFRHGFKNRLDEDNNKIIVCTTGTSFGDTLNIYGRIHRHHLS